MVERPEIIVEHKPCGLCLGIQCTYPCGILHPRCITDTVYGIAWFKFFACKPCKRKTQALRHGIVPVPHTGHKIDAEANTCFFKGSGHLIVDGGHPQMLFSGESRDEYLVGVFHEHDLSDGGALKQRQKLCELAPPGIFMYGDTKDIFHMSYLPFQISLTSGFAAGHCRAACSEPRKVSDAVLASTKACDVDRSVLDGKNIERRLRNRPDLSARTGRCPFLCIGTERRDRKNALII